MIASVLSPCLQCKRVLSGSFCSPRQRTRCAEFLDYIQELSSIRQHHILINELKQLIER